MLNEIVNHIKSRLGASYRKLELSDDQLVQILQQETLNAVSVYNPFFLEYNLDLLSSKIEGSDNTFNVPLEVGGFRTIGVERVYSSSGGSNAGLNTFNILGTDLLTAMNNYANSKLMAGFATTMMPPETFQYIHPGLLRLFNLQTSNRAFIVLRTTHRKDFGTFPYGLRESIMKVALGDVANDLLGARNFFQNISTPFAEINLNTDQLKEWSDKREEAMENLRKNQLKNANVRKIYVA